MKSLEEISVIELKEDYENSIIFLEERFLNDSLDKATILRLMFIYWELIIEDGCIKHDLDLDVIETKFKNIINLTITFFKEDPEYLWVVGYMVRLYENTYGSLLEKYSVSDKKLFGVNLMRKAKALSIEKPFNYSEIYDGQLGYYFSDVLYEI